MAGGPDGGAGGAKLTPKQAWILGGAVFVLAGVGTFVTQYLSGAYQSPDRAVGLVAGSALVGLASALPIVVLPLLPLVQDLLYGIARNKRPFLGAVVVALVVVWAVLGLGPGPRARQRDHTYAVAAPEPLSGADATASGKRKGRPPIASGRVGDLRLTRRTGTVVAVASDPGACTRRTPEGRHALAARARRTRRRCTPRGCSRRGRPRSAVVMHHRADARTERHHRGVAGER